MIAVDTNILVYAANPASTPHRAAIGFMQDHSKAEITICELVLVELYMALRNPAIFKKPYGARAASSYCGELKQNTHWNYVDYEPEISPRLWDWAAKTKSGFRQIIDARLALTLRHHQVDEFATMNENDFRGFGFKRVWNPLKS